MENSEKKTSRNHKSISSIILLLCIGAIIIFAFYYLYTEVIDLRDRTEHLESEIINAINQNLVEISNKEFEFYRQSTDTAISRINAVVGIMCAVATLFGLVGIFFTVISYFKEKNLEETTEKRLTEIGDIIEKHRSELDEIHIVQHILYADKHRKFEKYNYAINEYFRALKIDKDDYKIHYELGTLFAEDYVGNLDECVFDRTKEYLINAKNICESRETIDSELLSDCYMVLGGIYGAKASKSKKEGNDNSETLFNDSIEYFDKAIELNKYNLDIYPNLALTYLYSEKNGEAYKYFEKAVEMDRENVKNNNVIRRYPNVKKLLSIIDGTGFESKIAGWGWESKLGEHLKRYS